MESDDKDDKDDDSIIKSTTNTDHSQFLEESHFLQGNQEEIRDDNDNI